MDPREREPAGLKRISERDVRLDDMKYLAQVDVDRAALEERWGGPETVNDDLAEWVCFVFSPAEGEAFFLQREVHHPPASGFILSVTRGLFSVEAVGWIVEALGIATARVTQVNAEAAP
ncbi:hypothetical protein ACFU76_28475 [Streptomyces sp. NPDC057539]|uniref:hypothetical protein n=1 Tax=Streptomyces sp. NPDC057539 TaxID=3346159 RepID=UPI0036C75D43